MSWTIYCHTHIESGRRYIGQTKYTMMHRWNQHCAQANSSKGGRWHFPNAIRKYGKDAFSHRILEICKTVDEANEAEEAWINSFCTRDPQFGFNIAKGGEHKPHPIRNPWNDPEYRQKRREISRELMRCDAVRSRISKTLKNYFKDPTIRVIKSLKTIEQWKNPLSRSKSLEALQQRCSSLESKNKYSKLWRDDPVFRAKCSVGLIRRNLIESSKTHCKYGHEYTKENTIYLKGRECRTCRNKRARDRKRRLKTARV